MAAGAIAAAAGGSVLGNMINSSLNMINEWQNRGWKSQKEYEDYRADYDKAISDYFLDKQMDYNTQMSNTAYQRAIADMQAAGINPAAMAGVNAQPANAMAANGVSHPGMRTNAQMNTRPFDLGASQLAASAIYSVIAKDHDAARLMASEIVDNARHAHKMEELRENYQFKDALDSKKYQHENDIKNNPKADYYDELATSLRFKRLGIK